MTAFCYFLNNPLKLETEDTNEEGQWVCKAGMSSDSRTTSSPWSEQVSNFFARISHVDVAGVLHRVDVNRQLNGQHKGDSSATVTIWRTENKLHLAEALALEAMASVSIGDWHSGENPIDSKGNRRAEMFVLPVEDGSAGVAVKRLEEVWRKTLQEHTAESHPVGIFALPVFDTNFRSMSKLRRKEWIVKNLIAPTQIWSAIEKRFISGAEIIESRRALLTNAVA